jgi:D-serine dehydratase
MNERRMESVPDFRTVGSSVAPDGLPPTFDGTATTIDADAVERLRATLIPEGTKGMPWRAGEMTLADLGSTGWSTLDGTFPMPLMILRESALAGNIAAMADYCAENGVWLSPHGKTTMAPQLFHRQVDAGAWALTAATPGHLRLYRQFGVQRILYANQLVEAGAIEWIAQELRRDPGFEFWCLVDSLESVTQLDDGLTKNGVSRPVGVLIELGYAGGRCGVRDDATAREIANAVDGAPSLGLRGVECFEGLLSDAHGLGKIDRFLATVREVATDLLAFSSLRDSGEIVITAGGSAYFDRVIQAFVHDWKNAVPARVVLRSGCYITQDGGFYHRTSPLDGRGSVATLRDGIEIWSTVLSRPEAGLVICSMGRRDAPQDMGMPVPTKSCRTGEPPLTLDGASVVAFSDQHGHIAVDPGCGLRPGDLVGCSISHPCSAFDRWRVIPVVDDQYIVCDAIATFF